MLNPPNTSASNDLVLHKLRAMSEAQLRTSVIAPLLRRLATHVRHIHGAAEHGKDFCFVTTDSYGDLVLEVCQVKNKPFSGKAGSADSTIAALHQLIQCRSHTVLNPATGINERPQAVSLWCTHPLPDKDVQGADDLLKQMAEQRCKFIGPEKLLSLLRLHLPDDYAEIAYPGQGLRGKLHRFLNDPHDSAAFDVHRIGLLSEFFVDMGLVQCDSSSGSRTRAIQSDLKASVAKRHLISFADRYLSCPYKYGGEILTLHGTTIKSVSRHDQAFIDVIESKVGAYCHEMQNKIDRLSCSGHPKRFQKMLSILTMTGEVIRAAKSLRDVHNVNLLEVLAERERATWPTAERYSVKTTDYDLVNPLHIPAIPPVELLAIDDSSCIIGEAGAGKTSLARMIAIKALDQGIGCIYFPCSYIKSDVKEPLRATILRFMQELAPNSSVQSIEEYWEQASMLIIDGADESPTFLTTLSDELSILCKPDNAVVSVPAKTFVSIPDDLAHAVLHDHEQKTLRIVAPVSVADLSRLHTINSSRILKDKIAELKEAYHRHTKRIVVTTRDADPLHLSEHVLRFQLRRFDDEQLRMFFTNWFRGESVADEIWNFLAHNEHMREIARVPIVASLIAATRQRGFDLPRSKTDVYTKRFQLLLDTWDPSRGVQPRARIRSSDKLVLLSRLALAVHAAHARTFKREHLMDTWHEGFAQIYPNLDSDDLLWELRVVNSVITVAGDDEFSFGHLSFQEYLTARALMHGQRQSQLAKNIHDPWWREVALFFAGLAGDITGLVNKLLKRHGIGTLGPALDAMSAEARFTSPAVRDFLSGLRENESDYETHEEVEGEGDGGTGLIRTRL